MGRVGGCEVLSGLGDAALATGFGKVRARAWVAHCEQMYGDSNNMLQSRRLYEWLQTPCSCDLQLLI